ncbi:collagenase-like protease [Helicobacter monodelphidis]|uniref:peptidase U32 family protein n=1 Tax=Helicobacter sp. 15-1451 TaxID=2004995 RepID=UPI000DCD8B8F|nr:peptidase U32 family protein [Helicobacter sp. 15-1451]RAX58576.1 collagenase-like protease [Helicobacter sp. 15-1451]
MFELLSPAGNLEKLKIALAYGADALYGGVSHFSLRNRSGREFDYDSFAEGVNLTHSYGKKIYATVNGFPFNSQIQLLKSHLQKMADIGVDAFIVATPGVIRLAKQIAPHIPIHLSTQANVLNVLDAEVFYEMGVSRIIAAREISLKDLKEIKTALPQLELEIFVHGSMCFAFSGRCLISALQHGRVPNRGSCANDCRFDYEYLIQPPQSEEIVNAKECIHFVREPDTGVMMRLEEEEGVGTHIFNAKDLSLIAHIDDIIQSGVVDSFKIEGRTKSSYYVAITTKAYRCAIDDSLNHCFNAELYQQEIDTLKNRGLTDGYIVHRPFVRLDTQNHITPMSEGDFQVVAEVCETQQHALAKFRIDKNKEYEIVSPLGFVPNLVSNDIGEITQRNGRFYLSLHKIITKESKELESIHSGNTQPFCLPATLKAFSFLRTNIKEL